MAAKKRSDSKNAKRATTKSGGRKTGQGRAGGAKGRKALGTGLVGFSAMEATAAGTLQSISMAEWLQQVEQLHEDTFSKSNLLASGACLLTNPHTGASYCVPTSAPACAALKGTFVGGPCGGA